jgi:hypothetical protein
MHLFSSGNVKIKVQLLSAETGKLKIQIHGYGVYQRLSLLLAGQSFASTPSGFDALLF